MGFFCNQAGNFATTSSCQSADWLALVLLNRLTDWVQFVRLHIIISLKANMFLPFRHQHSTQCVLDLEISHVSVNQGLRKSDDRVLFHGCSLFNFLIYLHISLGFSDQLIISPTQPKYDNWLFVGLLIDLQIFP